MTKSIVIAIDGLSAAGKGTIASGVAYRLGFRHFSTGYIYRIVALIVMQQGVTPSYPNYEDFAIEVARGLTQQMLSQYLQNVEILNTPEISNLASVVSAIGELRSVLITLQRDFAHNGYGIVVDGRDIGTIIFPDADHKFFITATLEIRVRRRYKQLLLNKTEQQNITLQSVFMDLQQRDIRDQSRIVAPAIPAVDAIVIDTSYATAEESIENVLRIIQER